MSEYSDRMSSGQYVSAEAMDECIVDMVTLYSDCGTDMFVQHVTHIWPAVMQLIEFGSITARQAVTRLLNGTAKLIMERGILDVKTRRINTV